MDIKKILFIGAHPDDETSCSGSLIRFIEEGKQIFHAVFSFCKESTPLGYNLEEEFDNAVNIIGIDNSDVFKYNYPVRKFPEYRQDILEDMVKLNNIIHPDLIFVPSSKDIHQDHNVIYSEGIRAFKYSNILGYEFVQNNIDSFPHTFFIDLKEHQFEKKMEAFKSYESQKNKIYAKEHIIKSLAIVRGTQTGVTLAEAFETIRFKI